jgi:hypothetical protein
LIFLFLCSQNLNNSISCGGPSSLSTNIQKHQYESPSMLPYSFIYNGRDYDIIAIKANMAVGKTEKLYDIIDNYEKVVIVSFRISLDKQYAERLSNFELYLNINKDVYDTSIHNKIIVQMDSFNKVRGEIDLLIIDEITYRMFQLIYSQKKEENFNSIKQYLNNPSTKYS